MYDPFISWFCVFVGNRKIYCVSLYDKYVSVCLFLFLSLSLFLSITLLPLFDFCLSSSIIPLDYHSYKFIPLISSFIISTHKHKMLHCHWLFFVFSILCQSLCSRINVNLVTNQKNILVMLETGFFCCWFFSLFFFIFIFCCIIHLMCYVVHINF